jgi:hypothetical protein
LETQLELIESPIKSTRRGAQANILYLLQGRSFTPELTRTADDTGCFAETDGPEEQLHWVIENARLTRAVHGVPILVSALKDAVRRYNHLLYVKPIRYRAVNKLIARDMSENPTSSAGPSGGFLPGEPYDERAQETQDLLGILYFIVEISRSDDDFGDELSELFDLYSRLTE